MKAVGRRTEAFDRQMMATALRMSVRGLGATAFNPSVGAVIADPETGEVIARGWTQAGGRPHAEKDALRRAGARARGMTLYVTLEPCAHTGRLPTCADAVLHAGLARVVCALADPNPIIAGRGFTQLREAGIVVDVGLMADVARAIMAGHISHVTRQRPFVQLKLAVSADGFIAAGNGAPVFVTGPEARALGHLMRAQVDLIITGIGTVLADDPRLDCRLPGLEARAPHRLIFDSDLRTPITARILRPLPTMGASPKVWIATRDAVADSAAARDLIAARRVDGVIAGGRDRLVLARVLAALADEPIRRVLIEAGPRLARSALAEDLVDEAVVFTGAGRIGVAAGLPPLVDLPFPATFELPSWQRVEQRRIGDSSMTVYRRARL